MSVDTPRRKSKSGTPLEQAFPFDSKVKLPDVVVVRHASLALLCHDVPVLEPTMKGLAMNMERWIPANRHRAISTSLR